jgi:hypothetical protein
VQDSVVEKIKSEEVAVFGITRNETSQQWLVQYVAQNSITFDMLYQADEIFQMYGAYSDPTYVVIDKQGQIRLRESAYYSYRIQELTNLIKQLIEGF